MNKINKEKVEKDFLIFIIYKDVRDANINIINKFKIKKQIFYQLRNRK